MTTLDNVEQAIYAVRSSTRRYQARAAVEALKGSLALSYPSVADSPSAPEAWNRAIDLILEEKV
jgi:hypothetical protein